MPQKFYKQQLPNLQAAKKSYFMQISQSLEKERKVHYSFHEASINLIL